MSEEMPLESERERPGDFFHDLEATIKRLRTGATPPPAPPESWLKKTLSPAEPSSHQTEFNHALVDALSQLAQLMSALRETTLSQERRLAHIEERMLELRELSENLAAFGARSEGVGRELRAVATSVRGLHERAAALEAELAQARQAQSEKEQQIASQHGDLRLEFQARIQHLLDEQRVCIRQLSLQASEEAVLADRARRAIELKLEELAQHHPPPPA